MRGQYYLELWMSRRRRTRRSPGRGARSSRSHRACCVVAWRRDLEGRNLRGAGPVVVDVVVDVVVVGSRELLVRLRRRDVAGARPGNLRTGQVSKNISDDDENISERQA